MAKTPQGIPAHAQKVFSGVLFDIWQWEQELFDASTTTFEKAYRPDTALVIPVIGQGLMFAEQEQPGSGGVYLSLIGGRCEEGEPASVAAERELREETGLRGTIEPWLKFPFPHKVVGHEHLFIARDCRKVGTPKLDAGEKLATKLLNFDEFLALSDNQHFYAPELKEVLFQARLDEGKREELHSHLLRPAPS